MSTSDQQGPLTRKQLREIRLTGATPVITEEEAAAVAAPPAPAPPAPAPLPRAAEPIEVPPAPIADEPSGDAPLTRRQVRERERVRTASVPVFDPNAETAQGDLAESDARTAGEVVPASAETAVDVPAPAEPVVDEAPVEESPVEDAASTESPADEVEVEILPAEAAEGGAGEIVTEVPRFAPADAAGDAEDADDDDAGEEVAIAPVSAANASEAVGDLPLAPDAAESDEAEAPAALDELVKSAQAEDDHERPTVSPAFGQDVLKDEPSTPALAPSFDELLTVGDSTGSQHVAPSALIFTQAPGEGSLDGPVASTGEVLVTGSYELPKGLGSQGHAHGTTDGKDVDAVLIDGELPPASSPTPIAASAAVSTSKTAGEVIRPPAPDKGNKLMLALAVTAGGLALAVAVALVIAFSMNVF